MKSKQSKRTPDDYDSPWKDMIETYLKEFLYFFFPEVAENIDWEKGYKFLDKEFQKIVRDAKVGKRLADKLIEVYLKDENGKETKETWILIHVEVQAQRKADFSQRMYIYNTRIFNRYKHPVVSLAVLADEHGNWRPDNFGYSVLGCEVRLKFPVVKLLDYKDRWQELDNSRNVFAAVVMAHLKTLETKKDSLYRKTWKVNLIKSLYDKGYQGQDILNLFHFIDWLMGLPEELEEGFWKEIKEYEEAKHMPYVSSVERIGIKKGINIGREEGIQIGEKEGIKTGIHIGATQQARASLIEVLETRFDNLPRTIIEKIDQISNVSLLNSLLKKAAKAESIDQFEKAMNQILS